MNVLATLQARVAELKMLTVDHEFAEAYHDEIVFLEPIIKHMTEVQEKEIANLVDLSDLDGRRRKIAESRYNLHNFESPVAGANGWETCGNVYTRVVYLDNGGEDSIRQNFTVQFQPDSDIVVE